MAQQDQETFAGLLGLDETADNNKDFTVPTGVAWEIDHISASLNATGTVGNRALKVEIVDGATVIPVAISAQAHVASENREYLIGPLGTAHATITTATPSVVHVPAPFPLRLRAGQTLRIRDANNIAAADPMKVYIFGKAYYAGASMIAVVAKTA